MNNDEKMQAVREVFENIPTEWLIIQREIINDILFGRENASSK